MSHKFNYKESQFYFYHSGKIEGKSISLGIFLKDLFIGSKGLIKYNGSLCATGNPPLIDLREGLTNNSVKDKLRLLFPAEFADYGKPETAFRALTAHTGPNYSIGNKIISSFNANASNVLKKFDATCRQTLSDQRFKVDREGLKAYLHELHGIIAPRELSPSAHLKYGELLENGKLAVILSRVLLSMIFAFKPNSDSERHYSPSSEALKCIWCTPTVNIQSSMIQTTNIDEQCAYALSLFENGESKSSFALLKKLVTSRHFSLLPHSKLRHGVECAYATHMLSGSECDKDPDGAVAFLLGCSANPDAQYLLYRYYRGDFTDTKSNTTAEIYLNKAAEMCSSDALLDLFEIYSNAFASGDRLSRQRTIEIMENLAVHLPSMNLTETGKYSYFHGVFLEADGKKDEADLFFSKAAAAGHNGAQAKLRRKKRYIYSLRESFSSELSDNICIINGDSEATDAFLKSLERNFSVLSSRDTRYGDLGVKKIRGFAELIEELSSEDFFSSPDNKKIVAAFLSDDREINLKDGLELLDHLYNLAIDFLNADKKDKAQALSDAVEIYVGADYALASFFIDASIKNMCENLYFKVRICDRERDAAQNLLHKHPLFIPLKNRGESEASVAIFGNSALASRIAAEAHVVAHMDEQYPVKISIIGAGIKELENKFFYDAPSLYENVQSKQSTGITTEFVECNLNSSRINRLFASPLSDSESKLHEILSASNYFVVDVGNDQENLYFAANLRRCILKDSTNFDRKPFIAVHCRDLSIARLIDAVSTQDKSNGATPRETLDLYCFGMNDTLYSYRALVADNPQKK